MNSAHFLRHNLIKICILFILVHIPPFSYSQEQPTVLNAEDLINFSNHFYGMDDRLANGVISQFHEPKADGHPFFLSNDWQVGNVFSNGIKFSNATLKYNIESDEFFYINLNSNQSPTTVLNKSIIDSVSINNYLFVNSDKLVITNPIGYVELLYQGNLTVFIKYKIKHIIKYTDTYEYIKYYDPRTIIYLLKDSQLIRLNSKKDLLSEFSPYRKEIKKFLNQNKIKFRKANHIQLSHLIKYCDDLSF